MTLDLGLFMSAFTTLFVIMDPPGNLPIFMGLTMRLDKKRRNQVAFRSNAIALGILLVFGFFGFKILDWMSITTPALQISGGLLLLLIALQLLTGEESDPGKDDGSINVAVVPLGTPLLAGPGAIVAFMLLIKESSDALAVLTVIAGLSAVLFISWAFMFFATPIVRVLGKSGIMLLTKLSGMLLAAIATQLMISGVLAVFSTI